MPFTYLPEVQCLHPEVFSDHRGYFKETYQAAKFQSLTGCDVEFLQDNISSSKKGTLRGLHYQLQPCAQSKLVQVIEGEIWDVVVDIRASSPRFGCWNAYELSESNHVQLWIPAGFAHGFLVLSEVAKVFYKTTSFYAPNAERGIAWDDPDIGIQWPDIGMDFLLSDKDQKQPRLRDAEVFAS